MLTLVRYLKVHYELSMNLIFPCFSLQDFDKIEPERILETLCEFLMCPEYTQDVADCFPELLPALVSIAISTDSVQLSALIHKDIIHKLNAVILGKLIVINQDLLTYAFVEYICIKTICNKLLAVINAAYDILQHVLFKLNFNF